jgi:release factor glutamine methyltransferase
VEKNTFENEQVYLPEYDTYLLLEAALLEIRPEDRVLEVGTGSGFIASRLSSITPVIATDINPYAVHSARAKGVDVVRTDLFAGICGLFDLILFNPPYLPTRSRDRIDDWLEYALDGGKTGRDVIERFILNVDTVLAGGGRVLLLCSSLSGLDEVRNLFGLQAFLSFVVKKRIVEDETLYVIRAQRDPCRFDE